MIEDALTRLEDEIYELVGEFNEAQNDHAMYVREVMRLSEELQIARNAMQEASKRMGEVKESIQRHYMTHNLYRLSKDIRDGNVKVVPTNPADTASVRFMTFE